MIRIINEQECCGCGVCIDACPKRCISFEHRTLGAVYPIVDTELCISCGRCDSVCPMIHRTQSNDLIPPSARRVYAAVARDAKLHDEGSSGGMFPVIARKLIIEGYEVYGAALDECLQLRHACATDFSGVEALSKSKYIQSDSTLAYDEIREKLRQGKKILYTGTPCQVTALRNYLEPQTKEQILYVDFFCHGVPSQRFFDECISYEDKKRREKTVGFKFRVKKKRGSTPHHYEQIALRNNRKVKRVRLYFYSLYYAAFQQYITLRESCYNCPFCGADRASDVTIGDFHEIDKYVNGLDRFKGVSKVIINTERGANLIDNVRKDLMLYDIDVQQLISTGVWFGVSTGRPKNRDIFVKRYMESGIHGLARNELSLRHYWKHIIYYHMPGFVRKGLREILGVDK